jgi:hypothetical protein
MSKKTTKTQAIKKIPPPPGPKASWKKQAAYMEKYSFDEVEAAGYLQNLTSAEQHELGEISKLAKSRVNSRKNKLSA